MQIDIHADTVCPWCLIGIRRLRRAIAARSGTAPTLNWRSFQLNPDMPIDGMPWEDYLVVRFGSVARGRSFHEQIADAGKLVDVKFHFERIRRMPNSFNSHRLLLLAGAHRLETEFFDVLTEAFFVEGADIGDPDTLVGLAQLAGLPGDDARAMLDSDTYRDDILAEDRRARRIGLDGVPTFVFAGRFAVAGALAEEVFTPMFDLARSQNDRASGLNA